jgi:von Willebrand factor type A domain
MDRELSFTLAVAAEPEQHRDRRTVDVSVAVGAGESRADAPADAGSAREPGAGFAEVVLVDRSGSMSSPITKDHLAKKAAAAAIDLLADGVLFAVVGGTDKARMIYPTRSTLTVASASTRAAAGDAIRKLGTGNGATAIGPWLDRARELLEPHYDRVRHVTLLTDGKNEYQYLASRTLEQVLTDCHGVFTCDTRGIGADWNPEELRRIADRLQGTNDSIPDLGDLERELTDVVRGASRRKVAQAALRVRCTPHVSVTLLEQSSPSIADLAAHRVPVAGTSAVDFPTGPWSSEDRTYMLNLTVDREPAADGVADLLAAIEVVTGAIGTAQADPVTGVSTVQVRWVDIPSPGTDINPLPIRHREEKQLRELRQRGAMRYRDGDTQGAQQDWGEAVRLATKLRNEDALSRLRRVVRILDGPSGKVSLLPDLPVEYVVNLMVGDTTSTWAGPGLIETPSRIPPGAANNRAELPDEVETGPGPTCPQCGRIAAPGSDFCENSECDHVFTGTEAP